MISCVASVPRASLAEKPLRFELSRVEVEELALAHGEEEDSDGFEDDDGDDAPVAPEAAPARGSLHIPGFPANLQFGEDDDSDDELVGGVNAFDGFHETDMNDEDDDEGSDVDDNDLKPTDSVFLTACTDDDFSSVEMHVFDEETQNLYVHHDISLPAFPLALEWLRLADGATKALGGSFVAVGSFEPAIEIWNLDVLDVLEPSLVLGGFEKPSKAALAAAKGHGKKKKGKRLPKSELKAGSHSDAVLALSWNRVRGDCLASASADKTVKIWDLATEKAVQTLAHHSAKVACVAWHPVEAAALASASHDKTLAVKDVRAPLAGNAFRLTADVEAMAWNPHRPSQVVASSEDGNVVCFDVRQPGEPLWLTSPHEAKATTCLAFSRHKGLLATGSADSSVKLWNDSGGAAPQLVAQRQMAVGQIFSVAFDESSPFLLAAGGSKGLLALWDTCENAEVEATFNAEAA
ncbi:WD40-repeat-containing domain protein [Pelagophyceae sp. CCMP2097]|nr:WD40-repeat-containing domain protein [Pelagophyceae sp. CCMP2097]